MAGAVRSISVRLQAEVGNYVQGLQRAKAATGDLITELSKSEQQRQQFQRLGTGMIVAGAGIAAGIGLAAKAAIDWESAWAGVVKTVDGSSTQLAALEGELREMARTLPATHGEIAAVAEAAGQLGVATEDVADFTKVMIDLGVSTNLTSEEAATSIAQLMNVMGTAPAHVSNLGSALVELGNNGASTERDIIQMAQRIAGAGAIVGATEADVLALANALASAGIRVEAGGSAISKVLVKIASSASEGGETLAAFAEVAGTTADEFAAHFAEDPVAALNMFVLGLGRMNEAGQNVFGTLDDLGLAEVRTRDALLRLSSSGDLLTQSLEDGERAWADNTALIEEAGRRYDTTAAQLQVARNQLNDFAITMGEVFLPVIGGAADKLGGFAEMLSSLPGPLQTIVGWTAATAAAVLLLGGTAITAVTKIAAYRAAMIQMNAAGGTSAAMMGRLNTGMRRTVVWAGRATVALLALEAANAVLDQFREGAANVELLSAALADYTRNGRVAGELSRVFGEDLDGLSDSISALNDKGFLADFLRGAEDLPLVGDLLAKTGSELASLAGRSGKTFDEMSGDVAALDQALTNMTEQGLAPEAWDLFQRLVVESGLAIGEVEDQMPHFVAAHKEWLLAQQDSAAGIAELGGAASETAEEIEELAEAFERLFEIAMDLDRATIAYKTGLAELAEALDDGATSLSVNSEAGRDNRSAVLDQIEAIDDLRQANLDNGMSMDEANKKYLDQLDVIAQMLIDRGFEKEAVQNLIDTYRDIPEQVSTEVEAPFLGPVSEQAAIYEEILSKVQNKKRLETIMALPNADERLRELRRYRDELNRIDGRVVTTTIETINRQITQRFGPNAPQVQRRHGGVTLHAQSGLLREAQVFSPRAPARFAFAEPATGGEAFVPKRGDRDRSLGILSTAAGWHGATVVPNEKAHPGYVLTEDGSWVPRNFFDTTAIAKVTMPKPGFVQAEDGSWVPRSFYDTKPSESYHRDEYTDAEWSALMSGGVDAYVKLKQKQFAGDPRYGAAFFDSERRRAAGTLQNQERKAAEEMLRAVRAGAKFFEDFSFRGNSQLVRRFNDQIADRFSGPFTRKRVEAFLKRIIGGQTFDQGGWLQPGLTLANNATGQPERVLPPGGPWQWHGQRSSTAATDGMPAPSTSTTYNVYPQRADFSIRDLDALTRRQDALARADRPA